MHSTMLVEYKFLLHVYRGILADDIVYIFAHLHTSLLAEGNMLDINWLQEVKVLVKQNI